MIITLGRQHGSNGHDIARALADALGYTCYDKEIVDHAAENSSFSKEILDTYDEKRVSSYIVPTPHYIGMNEGFRLNLQIATAQFDTIRSLADKGNAIFVGRCADYIFQDKAKCLKVFIHADMAFRAKRIVEVYGEREQSPEQRLRDKDKRRAAYHRFYTNMKWGYAQNYHITLDSGELGIDKCADIIADLYKSKA